MSESRAAIEVTAHNAVARPLVPTFDVPTGHHPTVRIPENRRHALSQLAIERAKSGRGNQRNHERGLYGEYVLASWLDFEDPVAALDTAIYTDGGDGGVDLTWNGKTIDVKTVGPRPSTPCLLVSEHQPLSADYYVLIQQLNVSNYRILGYAPRHVVADAPVRSLSVAHNLNRVRWVSQRELFPIAWS